MKMGVIKDKETLLENIIIAANGKVTEVILYEVQRRGIFRCEEGLTISFAEAKEIVAKRCDKYAFVSDKYVEYISVVENYKELELIA